MAERRYDNSLMCVCVCVCACEVAQSCLSLCEPIDCSPPGSSVSMGFSRQEYWSGLPFPSPGDLPNPGSNRVSCIAGRQFNLWATREASTRTLIPLVRAPPSWANHLPKIKLKKEWNQPTKTQDRLLHIPQPKGWPRPFRRCPYITLWFRISLKVKLMQTYGGIVILQKHFENWRCKGATLMWNNCKPLFHMIHNF